MSWYQKHHPWLTEEQAYFLWTQHAAARGNKASCYKYIWRCCDPIEDFRQDLLWKAHQEEIRNWRDYT